MSESQEAWAKPNQRLRSDAMVQDNTECRQQSSNLNWKTVPEGTQLWVLERSMKTWRIVNRCGQRWSKLLYQYVWAQGSVRSAHAVVLDRTSLLPDVWEQGYVAVRRHMQRFDTEIRLTR